MSVYRHFVLVNIRSIRACKFLTPCSVRGGKYSNDTCAIFDSDSSFRRSIIFGSGLISWAGDSADMVHMLIEFRAGQQVSMRRVKKL